MKIKKKKVLKALKALDTYVEIERIKAENSSWLPAITLTILVIAIGILIGFGLSL